MTIHVRPATERDIPFILTGNEVIDQLSVHKPKRGLTAEYLREDIFSDQPAAYIEVVDADKGFGSLEPAAFILYSFFYLASEGKVIWASKVYIDPFCRKMGIGPALRHHLFNKYPRVSGIYGSVSITNKIARSFFTSLGGESLNSEFVYYVVKRS